MQQLYESVVLGKALCTVVRFGCFFREEKPALSSVIQEKLMINLSFALASANIRGGQGVFTGELEKWRLFLDASI